jgi:hypothetical protein
MSTYRAGHPGCPVFFEAVPTWAHYVSGEKEVEMSGRCGIRDANRVELDLSSDIQPMRRLAQACFCSNSFMNSTSALTPSSGSAL